MADSDPPPSGPESDAARHAHAKELFLAALAKPEAEREDWVKRACADRPGLRDDVLSLLAQHTGGTLQAPVSRTVASPGASPGPMRKRVEEPTSPARRRRLALGLALGATLMILGSVIVQRAVERSLRALLEQKLVTLLDTGVVALQTWLDGELHLVREFAASERLVGQVALLETAIAGARDPEQALTAPSARAADASLQTMLAPMARRGGHRGFAVVDPSARLLAFSVPERDMEDLRPGSRLSPEGAEELSRTFEGESWVRLPYRLGTFRSAFAAPGEDTVLAVLAPVRDEDGRVMAALAFVLQAETAFGALLQASRPGTTGETYAFDREGRMLSESRFAQALVAAGLVPAASAGAPASSLLLPLRDPGADLTTGARPPADLAERPLTRMAAAAIDGGSGVDVDGYRDYRGVEVVGAWRWLDDYGFAVATEIDRSEAYAPLATPRAALIGLLVLVVTALCLAGAASVQVARLVREVRVAQQLGQYTLDSLIGQGGSGQVWRARHAMLQRPTAVKIVRPDALGPESLARFEREVKLTARLTHANTIEIYDYGRTMEGMFFYAMELLDGMSLQDLVRKHGPQPTSRVVHVLRQLCASLAEAHGEGLVHRDVKPGNVMLCRLGGQRDVVKVLDFGLVKDLAAPALEATGNVHIAGTPLYMAPERLRPGALVDARCDVWAVGATAYKLLTGRDLWSGDISDVFVQILTDTPPRCIWHAPDVPTQLDDLVAQCLAAAPEKRPADAGALLAQLEALSVAPWTQAEAHAWWTGRADGAAAAS